MQYELIFSQNQRVLFCEKSKKSIFRTHLYKNPTIKNSNMQQIKYLLALLLLLIITECAQAQVGIGTATPTANAKLDVRVFYHHE